MRNTPVTVVDDFFDYPDPIREWGLREDIKYEPSDDGSWSGKRHMLTHTEFEINLHLKLAIYYMILMNKNMH